MGKQIKIYGKRLLSVILSTAIAMSGLAVPETVNAAQTQGEPWLLSEGRPAYASTTSGGDKAIFATDGKMTTAWGAVASEGDGKNLDQWLDVDLGALADLSSVEIDWQGAWVFATEYSILVSDDEVNWKKVYENKNGTGGKVYHVYEVGEKKTAVEYEVEKNASGEWIAVDTEKQAELDAFKENGQGKAYEVYKETIDISDANASGRYVRLETNMSWSQSENQEHRGYGVAVREFKIYGKGGVVLPSSGAENIAPGHPTSASSEVVDWDIMRESSGAFDGDNSTYWKSKEGNDEWVAVDLEKVYKIGKVSIEWVAEFGRIYDIQTSLDGENWTTVYRQLHGIGEKEEINMYQDARYVRMKGYAMGRGSGYTVKEFKIFPYQAGDSKENPMIENLPERRVVEVGEGSYLIDDVNLRQPREPKYVTVNMSVPIVSNDWWSSVVYQRLSDTIATLPYAMQYFDTGLGLYYANEPYVTQSTDWGASGAMGSGSQEWDLTLNTSEIKGTPSSKVDRHGDWSVDVVWSDDDTPKMKTTMVKGSPYIYNTFTNPNEVEISAYQLIRIFDENKNEILANDGDSCKTDHIGVEVGNRSKGSAEINGKENNEQVRSYGVYVPEGTTFTRLGSKIKIQLGSGENYLSIAAIDGTADLMYLYQYAYTYVTDTVVDYHYDEKTAKITTEYQCQVESKRTGNGIKNETLMCLFPHQWKNSDAALTDKAYTTIRGQLKVHEGNNFHYALKFNGIIPAFAKPGESDSYDEELMREYLEMFKKSTINNYWIADPYWEGKKTHPIAMGILIAEQLGDYETRDQFISILRKILVNWLSYDGEDDFPYHMFYSGSWGALNGNGGDFGMAMNLTDHHFLWGYFIYPAAVLASYDPSFVEQYGDMLEMLIRDCMNPDKEDELFPFMRNFDPYEGHSWAGGYADNPDGNNQESASEATFAWAGLYLWGLVTGNEKYRDAGIWGWTSEGNAILQYWFDVDDENWMDRYNEGCVGMVFGLSYNNGTYFSVNPSSIYGIHLLPVTPALSYMGYNSEYAKSIYQKYREAQDRYQEWRTTAKPDDPDPEGWYHIMLPFLAQTDPQRAVEIWNAEWAKVDSAGNRVGNLPEDEVCNSYWYLQNMNTKGLLTDEIWSSNYTSYQIFKQDNQYTATVWNPASEEITVDFCNADGKIASVKVAVNSLIDVDPTKDGAYGNDGVPPADLYEDVLGVPGLIKAVDYSSNFGCSRADDAEEGDVIGYMNDGDSLVYKVDVEEAGEYVIDYRIKSIRETAGGTIGTKSSLGEETLSSVRFGNGDTDWTKEKWATVSDRITLQAGEQDLRIFFNAAKDSDEITISWIRIYKENTTPPTDSGADTSNADLSALPKISLEDAKYGASSEVDRNTADKVGDGDKDTRWESEAKDPQNITIELPQTTDLGGIKIIWEGAAAKAYTIEVSEDGQNWKTAFAKENGKSGETVSVKFDSVYPAKYVRMNGTERTGGYGYSIYEIELFGKGEDQRVLLEAPVVKAVKAGESEIKLTWNAVNGAVEYKVYRALSPKAAKKLVGACKEASYTDSNLTSGTYYYWVVASPGKSETLGDSKYSENIQGIHISAQAVAIAKANVTAVKEGDSSIKISWNAVENTGSYEIYRTTGTLPKKRIAAVSGLSYVDSGLKAGSYQYRVVSVPKEGSGYVSSDYSEVTKAIRIIEKLQTPILTAEKTEKDTVKLSWNIIENAASYRLYRSASAAGVKALVASVNNNGYTDSGLADGTYYYWVTAATGSSNYESSDYSADIDGITIEASGVEVVAATGITVSPAEAELTVGEKLRLTAEITPENVSNTAVAWSSSDAAIATVDGGVVTALAAGTAKITVETVNGKKAECVITVNEKQIPGGDDKDEPSSGDSEQNEVESITLNKTSEELKEGGKVTLTATVHPENATDKGITWSSSDEGVATVAGGVVTAVKEGTATITATASNGKKAECKITVIKGQEQEGDNSGTSTPGTDNPGTSTPGTDNPGTNGPGTGGSGGDKPVVTPTPDKAKISSVKIAAAGRPYGAKTLYVKRKGSLTLTADVLGTGTFSKNVKWSSSNKKVATVSSNGKVKVVAKKGTARITAVSVTDASKKASITVKAVSKTTANKVLTLKKKTIQLKEKGAVSQIQIKRYTKSATDSLTYKVISGKKYVKVDKYGVVTSKVRPSSKAKTAKIEVKYGNKKAVVTVKIPKK